MQALDGLDAHHALVLGLVRQHRWSRDIADGVDARNIGFAQAVDHDNAAVDLDPEFLKPEVFGVADHAEHDGARAFRRYQLQD